MIEMSKSGMVLRSLIVALPCSVLSCVVALWIVMPSALAPSPSRPEADTEAIRDCLDELRRVVEVAATNVDHHAPAPALERRPVSDGDSPTGQLKEILLRLDHLERVLTSSSFAGGGEKARVVRDTPINWSELESLAHLHRADREAAKRSTTLLTPAEVVAKFGLPSEVGAGNGGIFFNYERTQTDGTKGRVSFTFVDGYLVFHEVYPER